MDLKQKVLIKERATSLFPVIRDQLNIHYELDPSIGSCFKYLYLCLYGPKRYLQEFNNGDLKINVSDVRDVFFDFAEYVPGGYGLQDFEATLIERHNLEVEAYLKQKNVVIPYRKNSMGLARHYS
jgi:hypothetical protein